MKLLKKAVLVVFLVGCADGIHLLPLVFKKGTRECLPEHLRDKVHSDILWGLVPVKWSSLAACEDHPPQQLLGNQKWDARASNGEYGPKPIPRAGETQLSVTAHDTCWFHVRLAQCRWDDTDHYHTCPSFKVQYVDPNWGELWWHWQMQKMQEQAEQAEQRFTC